MLFLHLSCFSDAPVAFFIFAHITSSAAGIILCQPILFVKVLVGEI